MKRDVWLEEFRAKTGRLVWYGLATLMILGIIFKIYQHQRDKALRAEPRKIYKATPWPPENSVKKTSERTEKAAVSQDFATPTPVVTQETHQDSEGAMPLESESSESDGYVESTVSREESEGTKDDGAAKARAEWEAQQAKLKERLAETDALLNESKAIVEEGITSLQQAGPILANHLNSLSPEEQVAFLEQTRKTFMSQLPPNADSDGIETAWQTFLDLLTQHGYEPK